MSNVENSKQTTPEQSTEFVYLAKDVHKENLYHLLGYEIILERMTRFTGYEPYGESQKSIFEIALSLMGYNYFNLPDKLTDRLYSIISQNVDSVHNIGNVDVLKIGKKVYKAWRMELKYYKSNRNSYE